MDALIWDGLGLLYLVWFYDAVVSVGSHKGDSLVCRFPTASLLSSLLLQCQEINTFFHLYDSKLGSSIEGGQPSSSPWKRSAYVILHLPDTSP